MKSFISIFLFVYMKTAQAAFITIYYEQHESKAEIMREVFLQKYEMPDHWIQTQELRGECKLEKASEILDLCINNKGELEELSRNHKQINALKILRKRGQK